MSGVWAHISREGGESSAPPGALLLQGLDHPGGLAGALRLADFEGPADRAPREGRRLWEELGKASSEGGLCLGSALASGSLSLWDLCAPNLVLYDLQKIARNAACAEGAFRARPRPRTLLLDDPDDLGARLLAARARREGVRVEPLPGARSGRSRAAGGAWKAAARGLRNAAAAAWSGGGARSRGDFVLLCAVGRQLGAVLPAARELRRRGLPVRLILPLSTDARGLEGEGLALSRFEDYFVPPGAAARGRDLARRLLPAALTGEPYEGAADLLLERWVPLLGLAAEQAEAARALLNRLAPAALACPDVNHPLPRAICLEASARGIPSLALQYGLATPQAAEWSFLPQSAAAVWGARSAEVLESWGVAPGRLRPCGSPRHEAFRPPEAAERLRARAEFGLAPGERGIFFLCVPADVNALGRLDGMLRRDERRRALRAMRDACAAIPGAVLLLAVHPEESPEEVRRELGSFDPARLRLVQTPAVGRLLSACELAVTWHSTTGLEAVLMGLPLLTLNLTPKEDPVPYAADGGALAVRQEEALRPALEAALSGRARAADPEGFLSRHLARPAGGAAGRIADALEELAARPASGRVPCA